MERLTRRNEIHQAVIKNMAPLQVGTELTEAQYEKLYYALEKLAKYETAEEIGQQVVMPCRLHQTVYDVVLGEDGMYHVFPMLVCNIVPWGNEATYNGKVWNVYLESDYTKAYRSFYDFGRTVFTDKEKADEKMYALNVKNS